MAALTTTTNELDIAKIVLRAHNLAGLSPPEAGSAGVQWDRRKACALDFLQTILDELAVEGVFARAVGFENVQLVAGTFIYTLSAGSFDVVEDGAYISPDEVDITQASAETPVAQKDRETWQMMSAKSATSRPYIFFTDRRMTPIQVRFWPVPNEAGTVRLQVHRLLADVNDTNATVDLERFWLQYLIWELAHQLAVGANKLEHGQYLAGIAQQKRSMAKGASNQNTPDQIVLCHPTGWNP